MVEKRANNSVKKHTGLVAIDFDHLKNVDELNEKMESINSIFPNALKNYNYWLTPKIHKYRWMPEMF